MAKEAEAKKEKVEFKAEVTEVLNLVIHSLYSHKEVFLRELISNAADAIDKHRHLTMVDENYQKPDRPYAIRILPAKKEKTLRIIDNGIGMSREEVVQNIGTIAGSGTRAFLEQMRRKQQDGPHLIGQFGVGFYSAFMVASKVTVETKRAGTDAAAVRWESAGSGGYTLEETQKKEHGTEIILHLKDDALDYLEEWMIRSIIKKYSDYVSHPILLENEKGEAETVNKVTAIWRRPKSEIKPEEYHEFYKYISHDTEDPLAYTHHSIEGALEFKMLLFIPKKAPLNFYREDMHGLRLHVKKMFVTDQCKELLPVYLRFVKGVVDSEDLPLNVSRETLQEDTVIPKMKRQLAKKIFELLEETAKNDPVKYQAFFKELGVALKEGVATDFENRDRLLDLLRYPSSLSDKDELISLEQYVQRMKPGQEHIFYITGTGREACEKSPHIELFRKKGIEVLYMTDVMDEWAAPSIGEYKGKKMKSVTQGDLDLKELGGDVKEEKEKAEAEYKAVADRFRAVLQDKVKEVRISARLSESPCCLVADEGDMDVKLREIMKAMGREVPAAKRILELNPVHPIIRNLKGMIENNPSDERFQTCAEILYQQALLAEGSAVEDVTGFVKRISDVLQEITRKN